MSSFVANFDIDSKSDMFSQDVKIAVNAKAQEGKEFSFQIKANSSESTTGSNLKFEPTMKGAGMARLGKAPVDMVVKLLKDMKGTAIFVNKYDKYPKDLTAFNNDFMNKGKTYYENKVLPTLMTGGNKITSDVSTVIDIQDIKRAVRHLVLLNPGEKPFHPEIGTGVRAALFQNFTAPVKALLNSRIQEQLRKYEPRIEVTNVSMNDNIDNNELSCKIEFKVRNAPQQTEEVDIFLQRLR